MGSVDILIPQMGEGLQEVRILVFLKHPGDAIKRDEAIYEMETDKATVEVESPCEGILQEWLAQEDEILPVGAPIARIGTKAQPVDSAPVAPSTALAGPHLRTAPPAPTHAVGRLEIQIPPRTRAYCRQQGIAEEEIRQIPTQTGKLMPADVDRYLADRSQPPQPQQVRTRAKGRATLYTDRPLSPQHRVVLYRLKRSAQLVVPATITRPVAWDSLRRGMQALFRQHPEVHASEFQVLAYCVAQVILEHPKFRSTLLGEDTIREYAHLNLGIAVQRSQDELLTALVPHADTLDFATFVRTVQHHIQRALDGEDQATEAMPLVLSYMGAYDITAAIPVLVVPASAVLFVGAPYTQSDTLLANLALTFDHRLMNGMAAANFINAIARQVQKLGAAPEGTWKQGRAEAQSSEPGRLRAALLAVQPGERQRLLERHLCDHVASLLKVAPVEIDPHLPLGPAGLNSLMALELTNRLIAGLGLSLSATLVWNYPTITVLAAHLLSAMGLSLGSAPQMRATSQAGNDTLAVSSAELEQLSQDEVKGLLAKELAAIDALLEGRSP